MRATGIEHGEWVGWRRSGSHVKRGSDEKTVVVNIGDSAVCSGKQQR